MNIPRLHAARVELRVNVSERVKVQDIISSDYVETQPVETFTMTMNTGIASSALRSVLNPLATIKQYYSAVLEGRVDLRAVLKKYALTERFEEAIDELSGFVDLSRLAAMLAWLEGSLEGYRLESFTLLIDPEFNEPLTVAIHIGGCDFEEWEIIVKSIKQKLLEEGFNDLAGKVTIVCIDVFRRTSQP
jgi:hypothetical protein